MPPKSKDKARTKSAGKSTVDPELKKQQQQEAVNQRHLKYQQHLAELLNTEAEINLRNRQKINNIMTEKLRVVKTNELRAQLDQLNQDFERNMERKDACIALLARYVSISEDQRKRALNSHSQTVASLLAMLNQRMATFTEKAEDDIARLKAQFDQEIGALGRIYDLRKKTLEEIKQATINEENVLIDQLKADYNSKIAQIQSNNKEQLNIMQMKLQEQNTELEQFLLQEHERYKENTDAKQHNYKYLLVQDQKSSNIIEENKLKIQQLERQINHWKSKIQQTSEEFKQKNQLLRQEKEDAQKEYSVLKTKLMNFRNTEKQRQKQLVNDAHEAEDKIVNLKEMAERIIRLSVLCGRLETEAERVNEISRLTQQEKKEIELEVQRRVQEAGIDKQDDTGVSEAQSGIIKGVEELDHVYKKLSQATVDRLALMREQSNLEKENRELREALQRFLSVGSVGSI